MAFLFIDNENWCKWGVLVGMYFLEPFNYNICISSLLSKYNAANLGSSYNMLVLFVRIDQIAPLSSATTCWFVSK